jgi:hypothetical protein
VWGNLKAVPWRHSQQRRSGNRKEVSSIHREPWPKGQGSRNVPETATGRSEGHIPATPLSYHQNYPAGWIRTCKHPPRHPLPAHRQHIESAPLLLRPNLYSRSRVAKEIHARFRYVDISSSYLLTYWSKFPRLVPKKGHKGVEGCGKAPVRDNSGSECMTSAHGVKLSIL